MITKVPMSVLQAASKLEVTSMCLISIAFNKKIKFPSQWVYVYDEDIPFECAYSPSMKAFWNAPQGKSSLQCEVYYSKENPLRFNNEDLKEIILKSLYKMVIAEPDDVLFVDIHHIKYTNVIFYIEIENYRKHCIDFLKKRGIQSIRHFLKWDYLWSDQSFLSGFYSIKNV